MTGAETAKAVQARRCAFRRTWRLRCPAVAASLEEAGDLAQTALRFRWLFAFLSAPSQRKSARTTNAVERPHEAFTRRIKTQTVPPSAETAALLFWALLASGPAANASRFREITMRKVNGWQTLGERIAAPAPSVGSVGCVGSLMDAARISLTDATTRP